MTREELEERLRRERIDPATYDLDGVGIDEAYCIEKTTNGWLFYYRERGHHNFEHLFSSQNEAIEFFLKEILQDPTTRKVSG
jgi:hypothetical protein